MTTAKVKGSAEYSRELQCPHGTLSHDALRADTLHPTYLSTNEVMNLFMSTIPLPHSTTSLLTVSTNRLINTFATLGP